MTGPCDLEKEVMDFLHEHIFDPVLDSRSASANLKAGIRQTITRMNMLPADKIVQFYWTAISGTDRSIPFAKQMKSEGFTRFEDEDVRKTFQERFGDDFLRRCRERK